MTVVLLGGCVACATQPEQETVTPHVDHRGPVGPVPAGLERYYSQPLSWGPCHDYARTGSDRGPYSRPNVECARLTVPMDYSQPHGEMVTLGLLRNPASRPNPIGSLVLNPGGPGASGMSAAASLGGPVQNSELGKRFDLVGFDPRGIGASEPQVRCLTDQEWDTERRDNDSDPSPAGVARTETEERTYAQKCAQRTAPQLLANMGTRDVARDMDVLRSALGDQKLTYLGFSYGTRLGSMYAEQFAGNVRAMVLDGALNPEQTPVEELIEQGRGFQQAFDAFVQWCAAQDECALGKDPKNAVQQFHRLVRPLIDHPAEVSDGRKLSYPDAITGVTQALYSREMWEPLNTGLAQLKEGTGTTLMALADSYYGRQPDGKYSTITDAFNAIRCVDDPATADPKTMLEADRRYREVAPFLDDGRGASAARDKCVFWTTPPTRNPHTPHVEQLPPTLVISTTGDPSTPYAAGVKLADALGSRLLTFEGTQHTVFLQGNRCVDTAGTRYLIDLTLPPEGQRCR